MGLFMSTNETCIPAIFFYVLVSISYLVACYKRSVENIRSCVREKCYQEGVSVVVGQFNLKDSVHSVNHGNRWISLWLYSCQRLKPAYRPFSFMFWCLYPIWLHAINAV